MIRARAAAFFDDDDDDDGSPAPTWIMGVPYSGILGVQERPLCTVAYLSASLQL